MLDGRWQIGICGTFDLQNYGDLLFPLLAEQALRERLGEVAIHPFSYHARSAGDWPYAVGSVADLPGQIGRLDALLVGGGFILRFDKDVAPGYAPPSPDIHHPTGYWLTPALLALQHDVPLIWNAPGMHNNSVPAWARGLMTLVAGQSRYWAVRDEPSRKTIERETGISPTVIADTAFGVRRLVDPCQPPSGEFLRLSQAAGLDGPYVVIQSAVNLSPFARFVHRHRAALKGLRFLALPIGPALGEDAAVIEADLPDVVRLPCWPDPRLALELISRSAGVVGHSYHLTISAIVAGVPVFTWQNLSEGKYVVLQDVDTIFPLPAEHDLRPDWLLSRIGRQAVAASLRERECAVGKHWDAVAECVRQGPGATREAFGQFCQQLPAALEEAQTIGDAATAAPLRERLQEALALLELQRGEATARTRDLATLSRQLTDLLNSRSWKLTAPARYVSRQMRLKRPGDQP